MTNNVCYPDTTSQEQQPSVGLENAQPITLEYAWKLSLAANSRGSNHYVRLRNRALQKPSTRNAARIAKHASRRHSVAEASSPCTDCREHTVKYSDFTRKSELLSILDCALTLTAELTRIDANNTMHNVTRQNEMTKARADFPAYNKPRTQDLDDFDLFDGDYGDTTFNERKEVPNDNGKPRQ